MQHCSVTGIDASAAMLELAVQRCGVEKLSGIKLMQADFASIDEIEPDDQPDAVLCVQALHEVTRDVKRLVFSRVREWLPAGRPFYILDRFAYPGGEWLDDWCVTLNWMRSVDSGEVLDFEDYHRQYQAKTDYIESVEDYQSFLEEAGFETICPYRCFSRALIIARA